MGQSTFRFHNSNNQGPVVCYYCGRAEWSPSVNNHADRPTRDHRIPRSRRTETPEYLKAFNSEQNMVWACVKCNQEKGMLTDDEYFAVLQHRKWKAKVEKECVAIVHIPSELQNLTYEDHVFLYKAGVSCD